MIQYAKTRSISLCFLQSYWQQSHNHIVTHQAAQLPKEKYGNNQKIIHSLKFLFQEYRAKNLQPIFKEVKTKFDHNDSFLSECQTQNHH